MRAAPDIRVRTKETPEGPAFYPFGSWGGGYILDARAERRFALYFRWRIGIVMALVMLFIPDFMPGNLGLRIVAYMIAYVALTHAIYWACVRDGRRTAVQLSAEESLRLQAEALGHGIVGLFAFLLALAIGFVVWRSFFAPYPHWGPVTAVIDLAFCGWMVVFLVRLGAMQRRLDQSARRSPLCGCESVRSLDVDQLHRRNARPRRLGARRERFGAGSTRPRDRHRQCRESLRGRRQSRGDGRVGSRPPGVLPVRRGGGRSSNPARLAERAGDTEVRRAPARDREKVRSSSDRALEKVERVPFRWNRAEGSAAAGERLFC